MQFAKLSKSDVRFWTSIEQAKFLLNNLNDDDIASGRARLCLSANKLYDSQLDACKHLLEAWCHISIRSKELIERGFELDEFWEYRLEAAGKHIFERCVVRLSTDDQTAFDEAVQGIFAASLDANTFYSDNVAEAKPMSKNVKPRGVTISMGKLASA